MAGIGGVLIVDTGEISGLKDARSIQQEESAQIHGNGADSGNHPAGFLLSFSNSVISMSGL
jgi:hypothetical protein